MLTSDGFRQIGKLFPTRSSGRTFRWSVLAQQNAPTNPMTRRGDRVLSQQRCRLTVLIEQLANAGLPRGLDDQAAAFGAGALSAFGAGAGLPFFGGAGAGALSSYGAFGGAGASSTAAGAASDSIA